MIFTRTSKTFNKLTSRPISSKPTNPTPEIDRITKLINDHPFPDHHHHHLHQTLRQQIPASLLSGHLIETVLGRLFSGHSNGFKALEFFKFCLSLPQFFCPSPNSFEKTLHILTRMRNFDQALNLMKEIRNSHPSLLTLKSMSIILSKFAQFRSFEETLAAFEKMENEIFDGRTFGADEFNVLLRAFCTERQMKEARAVFRKLHSRFSPNSQTFNILLLGFKEAGDITAVELFYHEMIRRGFRPNVVSYNIMIDAYCKKGCVGDGLKLFDEMERLNLLPTVETFTTLIHGAGIARNISRAQQLFDELSVRDLKPDIGAYNALMGCFIRVRDVKSALRLFDEMEEKGVGRDHVSYHTLFLGLKRSDGIEGVYMLFQRMVERNFVPKMCTVVMLMKFFCENGRSDLGLELWKFLVNRGCCPHEHAMDLLVIGLCCAGKMEEAYDCLIQVAERGRHPGKRGFQVLEKFLVKAGKADKMCKLNQITERL